MRRLLIALALMLLATGAFAGGNHTWTNIDDDADSCNGRNWRFNGNRAFVAQETIEGGRLRSLKVSTKNSPVKFTGGNNAGYTVTVCKAAEVAEDLDDIRVTLEGGELRASGPSHNDWSVSYHVRTPDGADIDVDAHNGPVAFRDVNGNVTARLANGPLALHAVSGDFDVSTSNGPISIHGGSGTLKVRATNGPLSVHLDGSRFDGTLDATTQNGPLSVKVPEGYASGVVVEALGRGPISCRAEGCAAWKAMRAYDDDDDGSYDRRPRKIELGRGVTAVRLSTVNGPVTIRDE